MIIRLLFLIILIAQAIRPLSVKVHLHNLPFSCHKSPIPPPSSTVCTHIFCLLLPLFPAAKPQSSFLATYNLLLYPSHNNYVRAFSSIFFVFVLSSNQGNHVPYSVNAFMLIFLFPGNKIPKTTSLKTNVGALASIFFSLNSSVLKKN